MSKNLRSLIVIGGLVGIAALMVVNFNKKSSTTADVPELATVPTATPFGTPPVDTTIFSRPQPGQSRELSVSERQTLVYAEASLEYVARRSPTAKRLLAFYRHNANQVKYVDEQHFMVLTAPSSDSSFFVLAKPNMVSLAPGHGVIVAGYDGAMRCLSLNRAPFNSLVTGLFVGHEIGHAEDDLIYHEPYTEPMSESWLTGEIRAHATVYMMLNEFTNGQWRSIVKASAAERDSIKRAMGRSEQAFIMGNAPSDSSRIVRYFGHLNTDDLSGLATQLQVDANMMTIGRLAKGNADIEARGQHAFMTAFYQGLGYAPAASTR